MKGSRWLAFLLAFTMLASVAVLPAMAADEAADETAVTAADEATADEAVADTPEPFPDETPEPEETEPPEETEEPAADEEPEETETPPETETPEAAGEEDLSDQESQELVPLDGAAESYTVSYYAGQTLLSQETVAAGGCPVRIPSVDGGGVTITGWLNEKGSFVVPAKTAIQAETVYYAWYAPALVSEHIRYINGTGNAMFSPSSRLTRAQAATILYNLLASKELGPYECTFPDVSSSAWYYTAVRTLASYKVLTGYEDGTFRPNQSISRAEFVAILVRMAGLQEAELPFSDVSSTSWAADYIATAYSKGWISGYGDGLFKPSNAITRAEAVKVTNRMLGREADSETIFGGEGILQYLDVSENQWWYLDVMEASIGHAYTKTSGGEAWTSYQVESCGLTAGVHSIGGAMYYVREDTQQLAAVTKGVNELDGGLYLAESGGYALCADLASRPGCVTYADGSQTQLAGGLNQIGEQAYIYWDAENAAVKVLAADSVNELGGKYYLANSDGYTICTDIGADSGVVEAGGKLYISDGGYTILTQGYDTLADTGSAGEIYTEEQYGQTSASQIDLRGHTYEYDGHLYYIREDYSLLTDGWQGYLYFGEDGRYTTGDAALDAYVDDAVTAFAGDSTLSQRQKLLQAYYYLRGGRAEQSGSTGFSYQATGESYARTRYNGQCQYSWAVSCAMRMFSTNSGMYYEWAAAYLYMARRLGFQSYLAVGNIFKGTSINSSI